MKLKVYYSDDFLKHNQPSHPENAERLRSIIKAVRESEMEIDFAEPQPLAEKDILAVHDPNMVKLVEKLSEKGGWIDFDTYVSIGSYEIAKLAAGAVCKLAEEICADEVKNGFALVRPPGHHADKYRSMGFCLFNNAALAANALTKKGKKVLIFDHDVHHGNGTQDIFYERNDVLYQSFHLSPHYPGTGSIEEIGEKDGEGFTVNAPLPRGAGEGTVMTLLEEVFIPIAEQFKPDIIIVSAGFDSHYTDMLGGLRLRSDTFYKMIKELKKVQPRLMCTLEGGYNLNLLGKLVVSELEAMAGKELSYTEDEKETRDAREVVNAIKRKMRDYWNI